MRTGRDRLRLFLVAVPPFLPDYACEAHYVGIARKFLSVQNSEKTSMAWYAYCLTEHQAQANGVRARRPFLLDGIQGVNGAPVLSYPSGEFAVVVSEYDRSSENGKLEDKTVLEHARVVSVCFR